MGVNELENYLKLKNIKKTELAVCFVWEISLTQVSGCNQFY